VVRVGADGVKGKELEATKALVVYECPGCGERLLERRCPDCNVFCRRLGVGGCCPSCGDVVTVEELGEG
jgi:predicted RNA-binding Zn-ribbon protein involved in translation (DUF1610 family)